jgi:hypothetical protein
MSINLNEHPSLIVFLIFGFLAAIFIPATSTNFFTGIVEKIGITLFVASVGGMLAYLVFKKL